MIISNYTQPNKTRVVVRLKRDSAGFPERFEIMLYDCRDTQVARLFAWEYAHSIPELKTRLKAFALPLLPMERMYA
jgi:hypothetical protein